MNKQFTAILLLWVMITISVVVAIVSTDYENNSTGNLQYVFGDNLKPISLIRHASFYQVWLCETSEGDYITCIPEIVNLSD